MTFREIRQHGNRPAPAEYRRTGNPDALAVRLANVIACRDGFRFSVIAGWGAHCTPRPDWFGDVPEDYAGPYREVEVGFYGSRLPAPASAWRPYCEGLGLWRPYASHTVTVYSHVPVRLVYDLIRLHRGEVPAVGQPWDLTRRIERVQRIRVARFRRNAER